MLWCGFDHPSLLLRSKEDHEFSCDCSGAFVTKRGTNLEFLWLTFSMPVPCRDGADAHSWESVEFFANLQMAGYSCQFTPILVLFEFTLLWSLRLCIFELSVSSWKRRMGLSSVLSQVLLFWIPREKNCTESVRVHLQKRVVIRQDFIYFLAHFLHKRAPGGHPLRLKPHGCMIVPRHLMGSNKSL